MVFCDIHREWGRSAFEDSPFPIAKKHLEEKGYKIITAQEAAEIVMMSGPAQLAARRGTFVSEGVIHLNKRQGYLTRKSLVMLNLTKACKQCPLFVQKKQVDEVLQDSVKFSINQPYIPIKRFNEDPITVFLFGQQARNYSDFLSDQGVRKMPLPLSLDGAGSCYGNARFPAAAQLWLDNNARDEFGRYYGLLVPSGLQSIYDNYASFRGIHYYKK